MKHLLTVLMLYATTAFGQIKITVKGTGGGGSTDTTNKFVNRVTKNAGADSFYIWKGSGYTALKDSSASTDTIPFTPTLMFRNSTANPTIPTAAETNPIMQSNGVTVDNWYRKLTGVNTADSVIYYTTANNALLDNWTLPGTVCTGVNGFFPTVFKYGSTYYMFIKNSGAGLPADFTTGDIYLYSSTNKTAWTVMNGGSPAIVHNATGTDFRNKLYNVGVTMVGSKMHILVDCIAASGYRSNHYSLAYATADISTPTFTLPSYPQIADGGNPALVYVPKRNAIMAFYSDISFVTPPTRSRLHVVKASLSSNLTDSLAWQISPIAFPSLSLIDQNDYPADFGIAFTPGKTYPMLMTYNYAQSTGHQAYAPFIHNETELYESIPHSGYWTNMSGDNTTLDSSITYQGKVGINLGYANPLVPLEVAGSSSGSSAKFGALEVQSFGVNNNWFADNIYYNAGFKYRASGLGTLAYFNSGNFIVYTAPSGSAGGTAMVTDKLNLSNAGVLKLSNYGAGTATFDASGNISSVPSTPSTLAGLTDVSITSPIHNNVLIYDTVGADKWKNKPGVSYNFTSIQHGDNLKYDTSNGGQFINFTPTIAGDLQTFAGDAGAEASGVRAYVNSTTKQLRFKTGGYWRWSAVTDSAAVSSYTPITFPTNLDLVNTSQVFTGVNNTAFAHRGLSTLKLPSGVDGKVRTQYFSAYESEYILGLDNTNALQAYTTFDAGYYITGNALYKVTGGIIASLSYTLANGEFIYVNRTGTAITILTAPDATTTPTLRGTITGTFTGDMWVVTAIQNDSPPNGKMFYPEGLNLL